MKAVYCTGIILFLLLFSAAHSSLAESFEVQLTNIVFQKETKNLDTGTSTPNSYIYSPSRDDMGIEGTFYEGLGMYEVHWIQFPNEDNGYIQKELSIKVFLSGAYSSEKKIKFLRYDYSQETNDPDDKDDVGIHSWFLEAHDIPYARDFANTLVFKLTGSDVCSSIDNYEKINQGNPVYRSIETIKSCDPTTLDPPLPDKISGLTVTLDLGRKWFMTTPAPDIKITPSEINFGYIPKGKAGIHKFIISNIGNKTLYIERVETFVEEQDKEDLIA